MTDIITTALQKFNLPNSKIAEMERNYMPLQISAIDDREGYKRVKEARLNVKSARVGVEKIRKELKADALAFGRAVDAEAARITTLLSPIESHLEAQQKAIDDEKERIRIEEEKARAAKVQARIIALQVVNADFNALPPVATMTDEQFNSALKMSTRAHECEQARLAEIEAEEMRIAEEERKAREADEARRREEEALKRQQEI